MKTNEIIEKAIGILKSVEKKSDYDMMVDWEINNGYDAKFDKQMKSYFATINPIMGTELHTARCDVWNATLEFYSTKPAIEECEIEKAMSEAERIRKTITAEDKARGVAKKELVNTNKGRRLLIVFRDGSKTLRKLYEAPKNVLNFNACERELIDLANLGSKDYRRALQALMEKYRA